MTGRVSVAEISADLGARAEYFCRAYFPDGHHQGDYWLVGDTSGAVGRSLVIRLHAQDGRKAGRWTDYATGEFGDLIDLLHAKLGSRSMRETLHEAQQFLGTAPLPVPQVSKKVSRDAGAANTKRIVSARRLFASGRPMLGTAAATYLHRRGIARFGPARMCSDISRSSDWQDCRFTQSETNTGTASWQRRPVLVRVQTR